jgi:glutaredoxin
VGTRTDCQHREYIVTACDYCQAAPKVDQRRVPDRRQAVPENHLCAYCVTLSNHYAMVCCRDPEMLYEVNRCEDLMENQPSATWIVAAGDAYCLNCVWPEHQQDEF